MTQHKLQILLSYSEKDCQYVAEVPALPQCKGYGWSYAAALAAVEHSLAIHHKHVIDYADRIRPDLTKEPQGPRGRVMQLLRARFGHKSLQDFCDEIGDSCDERAFGSALGGTGQRSLRIAIALALDTLPSELWPLRWFTTRRRDDQAYVRAKLNQINKPATPKHANAGSPADA